MSSTPRLDFFWNSPLSVLLDKFWRLILCCLFRPIFCMNTMIITWWCSMERWSTQQRGSDSISPPLLQMVFHLMSWVLQESCSKKCSRQELMVKNFSKKVFWNTNSVHCHNINTNTDSRKAGYLYFKFPKLSKKSNIFGSWYFKSCCSYHWAISEKYKWGVEDILFGKKTGIVILLGIQCPQSTFVLFMEQHKSRP